MSAIGGLLGIGGGASGTGYAKPTLAKTDNAVTSGQTKTALTGVNASQDAQNALLAALSKQNGLTNQSDVYNELQGVVNGTGPNPAQTALNQNTAANVANSAAVAAGQRGAGSNVGLIARQVGQQGAGIQQQAVGQEATNEATQSLNAINAAGNIANTQASNQIGQTNANTSAQQAEQQTLLNALGQQNQTAVSNQSNVNSANAGLAQTGMQGQQGLIGGIASGVGALLAEGGDVDAAPVAGPTSIFGKFLKGATKQPTNAAGQPIASNMPAGQSALKSGMSDLVSGISKSLLTPSTATPTSAGVTEINVPGTMMAAKGGNVGSKLKAGGKVPGKPAVGGAKNSYANDIVDAKLSPGEIVLPRSVTMGKDPVNDAAKFVQAVLAKRKARK